MPDIMMCDDDKCPNRLTCYRYMAIPCEYRQSYGVDLRNNADDKCDYYWYFEIGNYKINQDLYNKEIKTNNNG